MKPIQCNIAYRRAREIVLAPVDYIRGIRAAAECFGIDSVIESISGDRLLGSNQEIRELGNGRTPMYNSLRRLEKETSEEKVFGGISNQIFLGMISRNLDCYTRRVIADLGSSKGPRPLFRPQDLGDIKRVLGSRGPSFSLHTKGGPGSNHLVTHVGYFPDILTRKPIVYSHSIERGPDVNPNFLLGGSEDPNDLPEVR